MNVRGNSENCVEEPVAPEWLSKLESRRENLQRATKLSHEVGAGAPCGECGDKCPGLDLHFWRKVCRNCKCRKDQHKCVDDDLSSWAQFEILGQICSKPAFIKIKALASQPVQVDWVPPNTMPDVVSDYMEKLGAAKVPIAGSDAAQKRKQQLEFQVPPHDLNAALCDNLTDAEAAQLQQYVVKIRENCVGQGVVVRIGNMGIGFVEYITPQQQQDQQHMLTGIDAYNMPTQMQQASFNAALINDTNDLSFHSPLPVKNAANARFSAQMRQETPARKLKFGTLCNLANNCGLPVNVDYERDAVFAQILHAEPLKQALENKSMGLPTSQAVIISQAQMLPDFMNASILGPATKQKLKDIGVNVKAVQSALLNSPFYDALYDTLKQNDIKFDECRVLAPIQALREELLVNKPVAEELSSFVTQLPNSAAIMYTSPAENSLGKCGLSGSSSNDSGFGSKASTPVGGVDMLTGAGLPSAFQQMRLTNKEPLPPAPMVNCRDCAKPIPLGEVAVKAERAGKEIAWHPECFKCYTCRELLADLVYFFHGGQVYCGRDLAINLKIPRCKACDELIFTKEYTAAEGATFHIKHFCCYHCDTPLAGQQYIPDEKTNMPLCLKCYNEFFAATCQRCNRQIEPTDQGVAWGDVHWHSVCFICAGVDCGKSLIGGRFCVKQKMPFCSPTCVRSII
ncbi:testin [Bactrocera neohumeralis]|uniref:testin n=1 Tax=Bactrocera neohumeralis TaxID=98809 RepID=UPI0021651F62|nr:testin [Bactrocera neohumeralis]